MIQILNSAQYGFRPNKTTEDALTSLAQEIYESIDSNMPSLAWVLEASQTS